MLAFRSFLGKVRWDVLYLVGIDVAGVATFVESILLV
jgi:hypothetical protein